MIESQEDYLARLNIEGRRTVWKENHAKIEIVFTKTRKYLKSALDICEIGIGDGYLLRLLQSFGFKCTGIDISHYLIKKLKSIFEAAGFNIKLLCHNISEPLDSEEMFDVIYCLDVLEHLEGEGLQKAMDNIKRILKQKGLIIATLPWKENLSDRMVICPKCYHKFHPIGHFHSFHDYNDVVKIFGASFRIILFDVISGKDFMSKLKLIMKKTILRIKYYKNGLPNFRATVLVIAQLSAH